MVYLVDTNILLRLADRSHPVHFVVRDAVRKLRQSGDSLQTTSQNFAEFWNVATRPADRNGFGLSTSEADRMLRLMERLVPRIPDAAAAYLEWRRLITAYSVSGVQVHDSRLVAAMMAAGMTHILTFNTVDFIRYAPEGIAAVDPATV